MYASAISRRAIVAGKQIEAGRGKREPRSEHHGVAGTGAPVTVKVAALGVPSKKADAVRSVSANSCAQPTRPLIMRGRRSQPAADKRAPSLVLNVEIDRASSGLGEGVLIEHDTLERGKGRHPGARAEIEAVAGLCLR